jgi:hypothetical protein
MLRRLFSASFLFLTFTIVIAHEMIPHHHHDDHICFEHVACSDSHSSNESSENNQDDEACCLLSDLSVIIPGSVQSVDNPHLHLKKNQPEDIQISQGILQNIPCLVLSGPLPFRQNPLVFFIISQPEYSSPGLRAPPLG